MPLYLICLLLVFCPLLAKPSSVVLLGESYSSEDNSFGINQEVLERLFSLMADNQPDAVIFTGDMTLGLQKEPSAEIQENSGPLADNHWPRTGYVYNSLNFQQQLAKFLEVKNRTLGPAVPFYPIIARHEAFGPDARNIVLKTFPAPFALDSSIHSFTIDKCLFLLFSTAKDDTAYKQDTDISKALLHSIDQMLQNERQRYDYVFVVGNQPAFSTKAVLGEPVGLDRHAASRDQFWDILMKHRVTAYFCSLEHLYDRTNRFGIWQIISGGGGAPFYQREFDKAFYHYLLLVLPQNNKQLPKVQVFNIHGDIIDEFELSSKHYPIYQLRITRGDSSLQIPHKKANAPLDTLLPNFFSIPFVRH